VAFWIGCLHATAIQTMLARNGLPESRADLVALLGLICCIKKKWERNVTRRAWYSHIGQLEDAPIAKREFKVSLWSFQGMIRSKLTISRIVSSIQQWLLLSADEISLFSVWEQRTTLKCWEGGVDSERRDDWYVTSTSIAMIWQYPMRLYTALRANP